MGNEYNSAGLCVRVRIEVQQAVGRPCDLRSEMQYKRKKSDRSQEGSIGVETEPAASCDYQVSMALLRHTR